MRKSSLPAPVSKIFLSPDLMTYHPESLPQLVYFRIILFGIFPEVYLSVMLIITDYQWFLSYVPRPEVLASSDNLL